MAGGASIEEATSAIGVAIRTGRAWFAESGGMPSFELTEPCGRYLSFTEREEITIAKASGLGVRAIATRLGRPPSTISRELKRNTGSTDRRQGYRASVAQSKADARARRPKVSKLSGHPPLRDYVQGRLESDSRYSPEQISRRLVVDFPDDERMRISHEAIYRALYVQGRGELRRELTRCLRTGRALRKPRRRVDHRRERIKDKVMISERPAEVDDRAVPGHWEGDCATRGRTSGVNAPMGGSLMRV